MISHLIRGAVELVTLALFVACLLLWAALAADFITGIIIL
jgi:hypothetical protein